VHGTFDKHDEAAIQNFLVQKRDRNAGLQIKRAPSTELYQPLTEGEIRVLELYPGEDVLSLEGCLHIVSIDYKHPTQKSELGQTYTRHTNHAISLSTGNPLWYTALSYVWGVPVFDQAILLGDRRITITSSLAAALFRLRSTKHSIFLWIDQVCINQPDTKEKEQQIPLMDLIYTHATNTVIWLGDDDGQDPALAFEMMEYIYARLQMSDVEITPNDFERLDFPPPDHGSWRAIQQLLRRPWLSRLWTIQEAVLSRNLFVQCGQAVVCWDDLAAWCYVLEHCNILRWLGTNEAHDCRPVDTVCYRRRSHTGGAIINSLQADRLQGQMLQEKEYLLNSLVRTRYAQATEPKDKIYGVLGITSSGIIPDYSPAKSARDIYHEACLTQIPHLIYELLSCVDHDMPMKPSWVPDWSTDRVTEALGYSTKAWTLYRAGGMQSSEPAKVVISDDKQNLTLSGILFDRILTLGPTNHDVDLDIDDPATNNQFFTQLIELIKAQYPASQNTYPGPDPSIFTALLHTLLAGRDASRTSPPTNTHAEIFSLILDATTATTPTLPGQEYTYTPRRTKGFFTLNNLRSRQPAKVFDDVKTAMRVAMTGRKFGITQKGYFALVPRGTSIDDRVVVFKGACVPFVLRDCGEGLELLGEAYVQGIMRGEVLDMEGLEGADATLV
jgi:hypothetical protein